MDGVLEIIAAAAAGSLESPARVAPAVAVVTHDPEAMVAAEAMPKAWDRLGVVQAGTLMDGAIERPLCICLDVAKKPPTWLRALAEKLEPGTRIGIVQPYKAAPLPGALGGLCDVPLLLDVDRQREYVCLERRSDGSGAGRAYVLRVSPDPAEAIARVEATLSGGPVDGLVVRPHGTDASRPLRVDAQDTPQDEPARRERLSAYVEILPGRPPAPGHSSAGTAVGLLKPDLLMTATIDPDSLEAVATPDDAALLRTGDVCIGAWRGRTATPLLVRRIAGDDPPLVPDSNVLTLRPRPGTDGRFMSFLAQHLRTAAAARAFMPPDPDGQRLKPQDIGDIEVPVPDETVLSTIDDMRATQVQLERWSVELAEALNALLGAADEHLSVVELRSIGQRVRQRIAAGKQLDDLQHRVRTLFPLPMALPWRRAQTAPANLEGYQTILECAEAATAYLAALGIMLARSEKLELPPLKQVRERLQMKGHGVGFGDWATIVEHVAGSGFRRKIARTAVCYELTEFLTAGSQAAIALASLAHRRNDLAHGRGPKGASAKEACIDAMSELEALFAACEWVAEYPLRLVLETRWDDFTNSGSYTFKELAGDQYLVPAVTEPTTWPKLNRDRLYIRGRTGDLYLLSPLVEWRECPDCRIPSAFVLDSFDRTSQVCRLAAIDHSHSFRSEDVVRPLIALGLLPDVGQSP